MMQSLIIALSLERGGILRRRSIYLRAAGVPSTSIRWDPLQTLEAHDDQSRSVILP